MRNTPSNTTGRPKSRFYYGLVIIAVFYLAALLADFLSPYDYREQSRQQPSAPASPVRFHDADGNFSLHPLVYGIRLTDPVVQEYSVDESNVTPIQLFVHGFSYTFLGVIPGDIHLFGVSGGSPNTPRIQLLGTDSLGRDRFSRLLHGARFSMLVSPVGTIFAAFIGILIGITSGYSRRLVDSTLMGIADAMISLPTLILILAARAAFPLELSPVTAALLLIGIFALTGWAEMARLARGQVRSIREQEFVIAATATGVTPVRILFRHILPNISRPLIIQATLMLPGFLLAEVALSFLGVGLQEPEPSLGNLLTGTADLTQLQQHPVLLLSPAVVIFLFALGSRLMSDGFGTRED